VLNWSERAQWSEQHPFEAEMAIVVPERTSVQVIRFWQAFRDYKHGKDRTLRAVEAELEAAVGIPLRAGSSGERHGA
jgi:hypothetical protein